MYLFGVWVWRGKSNAKCKCMHQTPEYFNWKLLICSSETSLSLFLHKMAIFKENFVVELIWQVSSSRFFFSHLVNWYAHWVLQFYIFILFQWSYQNSRIACSKWCLYVYNLCQILFFSNFCTLFEYILVPIDRFSICVECTAISSHLKSRSIGSSNTFGWLLLNK